MTVNDSKRCKILVEFLAKTAYECDTEEDDILAFENAIEDTGLGATPVR